MSQASQPSNTTDQTMNQITSNEYSLPVFHFRDKKPEEITQQQLEPLLNEYQQMVRQFYAMSNKLAELSGM
jgi:hypothetical protein